MSIRSRHRSRTAKNVEGACVGTNTDASGNVTQWSSPYNPLIKDFEYEEIDDVIGNYMGNNPVTHYHVTKTEADGYLSSAPKVPPGYYSTRSGQITQHFLALSYYSTLTEGPSSITFDVPGMESLAKAKCLANIEKTPFEFGEDIVEMRKTLDFVGGQAGIVKTISKDLRQAIHGNFHALNKPSYRSILKGVQKNLDNAAKIRLVAQFGYGNLIRSLSNAMTAWNDRERARPVQHVARARQNNSDNISENLVRRRLSPTQSASIEDMYFHSIAEACVVSAEIKYHLKDPLSDFRFDLGIRGKDLLPTAWAVAPASWFIDSFYNIGDAIMGLENILDPNIVIDSACISNSRSSMEMWQYVSSHDYRTTNGSNFSGSGAPFLREEEWYNRRPWTPTWQDAIPRRVTVPSNIGSILNDAAFVLMKVNKRFPFKA